MADVVLLRPSREHLDRYVDGLRRGFMPDNIRGKAGADEQLERIAADPDAFLATQDDPEGRGPPFTLPDGTVVPRLPGYYRWIWDGDFCGTVGFRWARDGTAALPPHVFGHIGYGVASWKQGRGYATRALALILPDARALGLPYVELTTDETNVASQRVIEANGGRLVETFVTPPELGGEGGKLRYRIAL